MHVTPRPGDRQRGFSLLEVVVAAGLLLMTIAAVTAFVTDSGSAKARLQSAMDADRAVRVVAERLRSLPFCAATLPAPRSARGSAATDLVAAVFPHARVAENTEAARYIVSAGEDADAPPGSFVTLAEENGVEVRCVSVFLASEGGAALGAAELDGWSVNERVSPPSAVLLVRLTALSHGTARTVNLLRSALSAPTLGRRQSSMSGAPS
jgi:type II secretory pathway component PulJ